MTALLTIGVWLLLLAFVFVHADKFRARLNGKVWLGRAFEILGLMYLTGTLAVFVYILYRLSTRYDGLFKVPFLAAAAFLGLMIVMLLKDAPTTIRNAGAHTVPNFKGSSAVSGKAQLVDFLGVMLGLTLVYVPLTLGYQAYHWVYAHRDSFFQDGGISFVGSRVVAIVILVAIVGRLLPAVNHARDLLLENRPVDWSKVARIAFKGEEAT